MQVGKRPTLRKARLLNRIIMRVDILMLDAGDLLTDAALSAVTFYSSSKMRPSERRKVIKFYMKQRYGEFKRSIQTTLNIAEELHSNEEIFVAAAEESCRRLWWLYNFNIPVSKNTKFN